MKIKTLLLFLLFTSNSAFATLNENPIILQQIQLANQCNQNSTIESNCHMFLNTRASYNLYNKNYDEAFKDWNLALKINPKYATVYYNRALYYFENNETINALNDINNSILYTNQNKIMDLSIMYNLRGLMQKEIGDYKGAMDDFSKSILLNSNGENAYYNRGVLKQELKNFQEAINDYTMSIKIRPKNPDAFLHRGIILIENGKKEMGLKDLGYAKEQYAQENNIDGYRKSVQLMNKLNKR